MDSIATRYFRSLPSADSLQLKNAADTGKTPEATVEAETRNLKLRTSTIQPH